MGWRTVCITNRAKLDYKMGAMIVRTNGDRVKIFLDEISLLLVESTSVTITSYLMAELIERKIKVVFCDKKRNPISELLPYYGSHDTSNKVRTQIRWTEETKEMVWTEIVYEKIKNQMMLLKMLDKEEWKLLNSYLNTIEHNDETNREGHAAKVYFNSLFGKEFTRSDDTPINACLNYGYTILLSAFNREIVASGYITQLGIYHDNMFNHFNLSSDLMEPFRPIVDKLVYLNGFECLESEEKELLVSMFQEKVTITGKSYDLDNAISIYVNSIFEALNDRDISKIKFIGYEL